MCLPSDLIPIDSALLYKFPNTLLRALYPRTSTETEMSFSVASSIALYLVQFLSLFLNIYGMFFSLDNLLRHSNNNTSTCAWEPNPSPKSSARTVRVLIPLRYLSRHFFRVQVSLYAKHNAEGCTDECV